MGELRNFSHANVFVISLDRAVERREHMKQLCEKLDPQVTFVSGVDGRNLNAEQRNLYHSTLARRIHGCKMNDSEMAATSAIIAVTPG